MARKPQPWYREERDAWYVRIDGQQHPLGAHPEGAARPVKSKKTGKWNSPPEIDAAFRRLMGGGTPSHDGGETVISMLDSFITWAKQNRAGITASRYEEFCQDFVRAAPSGGGIKFGALGVGKLSSGHVTDWLEQKADWGPTTRRNAITALIRAFNWCCKNKGLAKNPIGGMEKPEAKRRTGVVAEGEFDELLKHVLPTFEDLMIVSYDSGARPIEIKELEARHCYLDQHMAKIPAEEAKGRKHARVFYFPTDRSLEIMIRLCAAHPSGPLFRNAKGRKWTGDAVKCTFERVERKTGRRYCHYAMRHSFITHKLIAGVDSHVVAKLAGHRNTAMVDQVYSHVADDHAFMLKEAQKRVEPKKE